jgi:hypothetical protein
MDVGTIVNLVLGGLNIGLVIVNFVANKRNAKFGRKLGLYKNRQEIYESFLDYIKNSGLKHNEFIKKHNDFKNVRNESKCQSFFEEDVMQYRSELLEKGKNLLDIQFEYDRRPREVGDETREDKVKYDNLGEQLDQALFWFRNQSENLKNLFAPYLDLTKD